LKLSRFALHSSWSWEEFGNIAIELRCFIRHKDWNPFSAKFGYLVALNVGHVRQDIPVEISVKRYQLKTLIVGDIKKHLNIIIAILSLLAEQGGKHA
jgi:hypothetical protein